MSAPCPASLRRAAAILVLLLVVGLAGCADSSGSSSTVVTYADRVLDYSPVTTGVTGGIFDESNILGEPDGATLVVSLGYETTASPSAVGGAITVGLGGDLGRYCIQNGSGDDLIVYENVFELTDSTGTANFTEAAFVEVSQDNVTYYRFSAGYPTADASLVGKTSSYSGMAGISVGGDGFDLTDLITDHGLSSEFTPCYVRVVDGGTIVPDYDSHGELASPATQNGSGADIDAVESLYSVLSAGLSP